MTRQAAGTCNGVTAVVIGAGRGLGAHLTRQFLESGLHTISVSRSSVSDCVKFGSRHVSIESDVREAKTITMLNRAIEQAPPLKILVFAQRYRARGAHDENSEDQWSADLDTSLTASYRIVESVSERLVRGSSIVFIGSLAADKISGDQPLSYHVAKAGLRQMARYYALTLSHRGIRVNIVTPGHLERAEEVRNDRGATSIGIGNTTVKLSVGYQDVFEAASFLSSENAASITGQELVIDQGLSLYFYGQPANLGSDEGSRS